MCGGAALGHHGHCPSVKVELLAPSHCASRRAELSEESVSASEAVVFVDGGGSSRQDRVGVAISFHGGEYFGG